MTTLSLDSVLEGLDVGVALIEISADAERRFLAVNGAARSLLGMSDDCTLPAATGSTLPERSRHGMDRLLRYTHQSGDRRVVLLDGGWVIISSTELQQGQLVCLTLRPAEGAAQHDRLASMAAQLLAPIFGELPVYVSMLASGQVIPLLNNLHDSLAVYEPTNQDYLSRVHPDDRARVLGVVQSISAGFTQSADLTLRSHTYSGVEVVVDTTMQSLASSSIEATIVIARPRQPFDNSVDGTDSTYEHLTPARLQKSVQLLGETLSRHLTGELLEWQSLYDSLTGLATRALLLDRTQEAMTRSRTAVTVLHLDLDKFKRVNDSLGRAVGDMLLLAVAERVQSRATHANTIARIGSDEFAILLEHQDPVATARDINNSLLQPFVVTGVPTTLTASIGISRTLPGETDPVALLGRADTAMSRAKEAGRNRFELFDPTMQNQVRDQMATEELLRRSMSVGGFRLVYQPIVDLRSGTVQGYEALLRWDQADRPSSPAEFIPIAERMGLINELGAWVLDESLAQMSRWRELGEHAHNLYLSVNLSPLQLQDPKIVGSIRDSLSRHELPADRLVLEITESAVMEDAASALRTLTSLKELGLQLSIDDFGTGYSSLAYLKRFPVDYLKIDRAFVTDIAENESDRAIARAMTHLAEAMNLNVVAEGIETQEQLVALKDLGCELGQGYFFARPRNPEDVTIDLRDAR